MKSFRKLVTKSTLLLKGARGKAKLPVSLVDNAEQKRQKAALSKTRLGKEKLTVVSGFCDDMQDLLQTAYRQKTCQAQFQCQPNGWIFFFFKGLWEKKEEVACGGGTNDCPFVCCWGLEMEEGKREGLDAARLYWPHRKHMRYLRCHIGDYARASTAYVVHA